MSMTISKMNKVPCLPSFLPVWNSFYRSDVLDALFTPGLQVLNTSEDSIISSFAYEETKAWRGVVDFLNAIAEPTSELVSPSQGYRKKTLLPTN